MMHELKTWPEYFEEVYHSAKLWELRKNDRDYKVGDILLLKDWNPETGQFTGRYIFAMVNYMLTDAVQFGLMDGYCIMSLDKIQQGFTPNFEHLTL